MGFVSGAISSLRNNQSCIRTRGTGFRSTKVRKAVSTMEGNRIQVDTERMQLIQRKAFQKSLFQLIFLIGGAALFIVFTIMI